MNFCSAIPVISAGLSVMSDRACVSATESFESAGAEPDRAGLGESESLGVLDSETASDSACRAVGHIFAWLVSDRIA